MSVRLRVSPVAGVVFALGLPACGASSAAQPAAAPEVVVAVAEPGAQAAAPDASSQADAKEAPQALDKATKVDLEALQLQMLRALSSSGATTSSVLSADSVGLLDAMAASSAGVGGVGGLQTGTGGGGALRGGGGGGGLAGIGSGPGPAGTATAPKASGGPTAAATVAIDSKKGGAVANAAAVIAGTVAGMRRCYQRELTQDPGAATGSVRFDAKIGPNGEVLSVQPGSANGVAAAVVTCAQARLASAQFAPPDGGSAELGVRVVFDKQQP